MRITSRVRKREKESRQFGKRIGRKGKRILKGRYLDTTHIAPIVAVHLLEPSLLLLLAGSLTFLPAVLASAKTFTRPLSGSNYQRLDCALLTK